MQLKYFLHLHDDGDDMVYGGLYDVIDDENLKYVYQSFAIDDDGDVFHVDVNYLN